MQKCCLFALVSLVACGGSSFSGTQDAGDDAQQGADVAAGSMKDSPSSSDVQSAADAEQLDAGDEHAHHEDAGGDVEASSPPDAGSDAPPALCCATSCQGTSLAYIACGMPPQGDWTCNVDQSDCHAMRCAAGAMCTWIVNGTACLGTIEACQ